MTLPRPIRTIAGAASLALVALVTAGGVHAQAPAADAFPSKPIRMVVPTAVGSGSDVFGRALAAVLANGIGQPVVIDNRPGAAGAIGVASMKTAPADGYTIVFGNLSSVVNAPLVTDPPPYDPTKDLEPVAVVYNVVLALVTQGIPEVRNLREFIGHLRSNPGKLNYASPGPGSFAHLWVEMFKHLHKVDIVHIPYKGAGPALQAILAGEANLAVAETTIMSQLSRAKSASVIVQLGHPRSQILSHVETAREAGYPELTSEFWFGMLAPRGTPARIVKRLNEEINRAMTSPEMKQRVAAAGGDAVVTDPETFTKMIARDHALWAPIVKTLGIKGS